MMQTRSSQSPPNSSTSQTESALITQKTFWSTEDETALIEFLIERKAEAGDGANFKQSVWNAAAEEMVKHTTKGPPKSADSCKTKWA
jgi:hypothetical protein